MPRGPFTLSVASALALALGAAAPSVAATAAQPTSHATSFQTASGTVVCGIALVFGTHFDRATGQHLNGRWPGLQCSAPGIPRAPGNIGDPFVQLGQGRAGRARLVDLSQDDLLDNGAFPTLAPGTTWTRDRITCRIHSARIACSNSSRHGFTLRAGKLTRH